LVGVLEVLGGLVDLLLEEVIALLDVFVHNLEVIPA